MGSPTSVILFGSDKSERCYSLLSANIYSDLMLEITDVRTKKIHKYKVHRCILAVASPVWESSIRWSKGDVLKIEGFPTSVIYFLVNFAYTDKAFFRSLEFCLEVLVAADFYCLPDLVDHCKDFIMYEFSNSDVDVEDFVSAFNIGSLYDMQSLIELCIAYIEDNSESIFFGDDFLSLSLKSITYILSVKNYLLSEFSFIVGIFRWSLAQTTVDNMRDYLINNEIMRFVRFKLLSPKNLIEIFESFTCLFSESERYEILRCVIMNEPFTYDFLHSSNVSRGKENVISDDTIMVFSPPLVITEEFTYFGHSIGLPIMSMELEPRLNTFIASFRGRYEESVTVKFSVYNINFEGILETRTGTVLHMPCQINLEMHNMSTLKIKLVLNRPGIYMKNRTSLNYGLVRSGSGIIRGIYNHEKQSNNVLTSD